MRKITIFANEQLNTHHHNRDSNETALLVRQPNWSKRQRYAHPHFRTKPEAGIVFPRATLGAFLDNQ